MKVRGPANDWEVRFEEIPEADAAWGWTLQDTHRVLIDPRAPADRQAQVLLHELIHVAYRDLHITQSLDEEAVASLVGSALAGMIRQPPVLAALAGAWAPEPVKPSENPACLAPVSSRRRAPRRPSASRKTPTR